MSDDRPRKGNRGCVSERAGVSGRADGEGVAQLHDVTAVAGVVPGVRDVVVLVADPASRSRLRAALEAGPYRTVLPPQILSWAVAQHSQVLLVTDDSPRTSKLRAALLTAAPEAACVVLVDEPTPARCRELLASCLAVLPATANGADLLAAVAAVDRRLACLPATAVQALTGGDGRHPGFTSHELTWLRKLADGAKVAALARAAGYSQREMYRLLADLYARLGASTRTEALLRADRWGLLTIPAASTTHDPQSSPTGAEQAGLRR